MNEDNKIVHNERKIVDSNYPPRSLSDEKFVQIILYGR